VKKSVKEYLKWDFWKGEEQVDAEAIRRDRDVAATYSESEFWNWLAQELVLMSNNLLARWMKGGLPIEVHERLSGQVELLGTILDLPQTKLREYDAQLKGEREAQKPFLDPIDQDQMSPVPDETEWNSA